MDSEEVVRRTLAMIRHVEWYGQRVRIRDLHGARYAIFAYHLTQALEAGGLDDSLYAAFRRGNGSFPIVLMRCACGVYHHPDLFADRACCPETRNPQLDRIIRETRLAGGEGA